MSDTKLTRLETEAKRRGMGRRVSVTKALEDARKDYAELMAWTHGILEPKDIRERFGKIVGTDASYALPACCEADAIRRPHQLADTNGLALRIAMWHILDHDRDTPDMHQSDATRMVFETLKTKAPDVHDALWRGSSSPLPADPVADEHALTERLREAAAQSRGVPAPEPATVATDLPKPSPVAPRSDEDPSSPPPIERTQTGAAQWPITTAWGLLASREVVYLGPTDQTPPIRLRDLERSDPERYAGLRAELKSRGLV